MQTSLLGPKGRVALFIDGVNFYHTLRELQLHVDYRRLLSYVADDAWLVKATYYTTLLQSQSPEWLVRLTDWLAYNSYHVVTKPARYVRRHAIDEEGNEYWVNEIKGDTDIEITVDMMSLADHCDTLYLFSGDEAFVYLVKAVQKLNSRVIVVSSELPEFSRVDNDLRRQADEFIELTTITQHICRLDV